MALQTLTDIFIYPVKSLGGVPLDKASVRGKGLQWDRRWMLVDNMGTAMTQRTFPAMALFKVRIDGRRLLISYAKEGREISATGFAMTDESRGKLMTARIWDDTVEVSEVNRDLSDWFSDYLGTACKLVAFPEENARPVDPGYSEYNGDVSLADAYPFLVIGQSSLDDLNNRLEEPVPMNRFRPNFVFKGGEAFAEDGWKHLSIGNVRFVAVKKSARCVLTTVNQATAVKGHEPLRTLSSYRKIENKVYFGQNLIALEDGEVAVGDPVISGR